MIVNESRRRRRLDAHRTINDLQTGDFVRRRGHRGVGLVESVEQGFAWVAWKDGRKDYLPVVTLRRVRSCGHALDSRRFQP